MSTTTVATYEFETFTATEKIMEWNGTRWRYTVSGHGDRFLLAILANVTGHLMALPFAEEFREQYTTIALSIPPIQSFAATAEGLKALLDAEGVQFCDAIGHSNGGVHLQNLIAHYPDVVNKVVFSHSLTSMAEDDAYTTNASEVNVYKRLRKALKIVPVSVLTFLMSRMVLPKMHLQSGKKDTDRLIALCKEDFKRIRKQDFYTMSDCMEDFLFNHIFTSEPYAGKPQDVLIVDSPTDKVANPLQRAEMLRLCPRAREHHFPTGGHVTLINCKDEYFSLLHDFWD